MPDFYENFAKTLQIVDPKLFEMLENDYNLFENEHSITLGIPKDEKINKVLIVVYNGKNNCYETPFLISKNVLEYKNGNPNIGFKFLETRI